MSEPVLILGTSLTATEVEVTSFPELLDIARREVTRALNIAVADSGLIPADDDVTILAHRFEVPHYLWDEEYDEPLRDEEGEPIVDPSQPPTPMIRLTAERAVYKAGEQR